MAKNPKKRENALARKEAKRRAKQRERRRAEGTGMRAFLNEAGQWPLAECLISPEWRDTTKLTQILVARESPTGRVATACLLIDLGCLGVKNAFASSFPTMSAYRGRLRAKITAKMHLTSCDPDLAAKVIRKAVVYARSMGFEPNKDTSSALKILGETHPENCHEDVPLGGPHGRPFYMVGPDDNMKQVLRTLDRTVGPGNYDFIAPPF